MFEGISHVRGSVIESYRVRKLEQYGEDDSVGRRQDVDGQSRVKLVSDCSTRVEHFAIYEY